MEHLSVLNLGCLVRGWLKQDKSTYPFLSPQWREWRHLLYRNGPDTLYWMLGIYFFGATGFAWCFMSEISPRKPPCRPKKVDAEHSVWHAESCPLYSQLGVFGRFPSPWPTITHLLHWVSPVWLIIFSCYNCTWWLYFLPTLVSNFRYC